MPIADLHCHYPMHLLEDERRDPVLKKMVRVRKRPRWDKLKALILSILARLFNFSRVFGGWRVDLERLEAGKVTLVFSVLFMPDAEMDLKRWPEGSPNDESFAALVDHLDQVEEDLGIEGPPGARKAVIVKSKADLEPKGGGDTLPRFAHCIEGGFHLGAVAEKFDERVQELSKRGVAYITLAHLFWRQIATNAPALPFLTDGQYRHLFPQPQGVGLNALGKAAVRAMYTHRVLVDISHMSEAAIADTFELLDELDHEHGLSPEETPVIATHAGYRFGVQSYMLSEETIGQIARRKGLVGLIMAHHQLNDGLYRKRGDLRRTLAAMHAHIDMIASIADSYDHIGIGSDLDGFIKPTVGGIEKADDLERLIGPLHETYGEAADAILHGNALRVLKTTLADPVY